MSSREHGDVPNEAMLEKGNFDPRVQTLYTRDMELRSLDAKDLV